MSSTPQHQENLFWQSFQVTGDDLDYIKNYLFESETPKTVEEIRNALVSNRIEREKSSIAKSRRDKGPVFTPKDSYKIGDKITISTQGWDQCEVVSIRPSHNPEMPPFTVIEVKFNNGTRKLFASELQEHMLNNPQQVIPGMEYLDADFALREHGVELSQKIKHAMENDEDLVASAARWFHRSLLIDINIGHLNLAEAILDMNSGGPLSTANLIEQLDLPAGENPALLEFSLNRALQEDPRFDEVGPTGEVLWFLEKLEPEDVRSIPLFLRQTQEPVDSSGFTPQINKALVQLDDEGLFDTDLALSPDVVQIVLTYPHWRAGTIPLSSRTNNLFPTALESPRIKFDFIDSDTKSAVNGWVVRPHHYVAGLRQWYLDNNIVPGTFINLHKADDAGNVVINANRHKPTKEWVRTALVGADGGIVLALLKQQMATAYDEQMTTIIPDVEALDRVWQQTGKARLNTGQALLRIARELSKINPQGHIHAIELFSSVNVIKRVSAAVVFTYLTSHPMFSHVGDLYFRLNEDAIQENL